MSEELTKKTKTKRRIKQTKDPAQAGSSYSLQRTSVQEKQADQFKEEVEYVDHKDTETDQPDRIGKTAFGVFPDDFQKGIPIGIPQKHKVSIELRVDQVDHSRKKKNAQDRFPDIGI